MADLEQLQRDAAIERLKLEQSLGALSGTTPTDHLPVQPGALWGQLGAQVGKAVLNKARENPAGFALAGAGLAMLATGKGARTSPTATLPETTLDVSDVPAPSPEPVEADTPVSRPLIAGAIAVGVGTLMGVLYRRRRNKAQDEAQTELSQQEAMLKAAAAAEMDATARPAPTHSTTAPHWHP